MTNLPLSAVDRLEFVEEEPPVKLTIDLPSAIPPEVMAGVQEAAELASKRIRDPETMRRACERMDRMREETYRTHGLLDVGVAAIRELRDA